ncbi:MAG TPA: hypothetical protein VIA11_13155 [Acidimicrobiia bacterium]|jgi:hypothetical protein|nr:hypothetical protein [Acidimicrobiia bacterium]
MNDDELGRHLGHSIERRVRSVTPRVHLEELLVRTQRRLSRQRRILVAAAVAVLLLGGLAGYLVGHADDDHRAAVNAALDDGAPRAASAAPGFEPANVEAANAEIEQAFHSAFDGGVDPRQRADAIQNAASIESLTQSATQNAARFGYTAEQLAGTTTSVLATRFIDSTHAIVQFSITIPGHGEILRDRVGYAVLVDGRWKVALRTECDLLSLDGLGAQCPPAPATASG